MIIERLREAEAERMATAGVWTWLLQRVSAALLVVLVLGHFWLLHYAVVGEKITFDRVLGRLQSGSFFFVLDVALLAVVIFHGFNGIRTVIVDFGIGQRARVVLSLVLAALGAITFLYGMIALLAFFK